MSEIQQNLNLMTMFNLHSKQTAPSGSIELMEAAEKAYGFIPNLIGVLAESPHATEAYLTLARLFDKSTLTRVERHLVLLAINRYHECRYCMAAHTAAAEMQKVPRDVIEALRNDQPIADPKLEALRTFVTKVVDQRGWLSSEDLQAFFDAGYTKANVLETILAVSYKTLSNYVNNITGTPIDAVFKAKTWTPVKAHKAA